jgi:hypothetical protein
MRREIWLAISWLGTLRQKKISFGADYFTGRFNDEEKQGFVAAFASRETHSRVPLEKRAAHFSVGSSRTPVADPVAG